MSVTDIARVLIMIGVLGLAKVSPAEKQTPAEPAEPKPSPTVQKLLDEATTGVAAKWNAEALALAERALVAAHAENDGAGEAQAQRLRAQVLSAMNRRQEALSAWEAAAATWARLGDGPGQVEALAAMAAQLDLEQRDKAARLRAQALGLGKSESRRPLAAAQALQMAGQIYFDRQELNEAGDFWLVALSLRERQAPNSLDVAASLNNLGRVAWKQGDLATAREYHRKALAIQEEKSPNSLDVAMSLSNLGLVARKQGDLATAREYYRKALAIREEKAPGSLDVAMSLNNLGVIAWYQGDLATAREYYRKALAIQKEKAPKSLNLAGTFNNLGIVAERQGDLAAAREYYRKALAIQEEKAPNSLDVAISLNNLGTVAGDQGDLAAAREYHRKALAIREKKAPNSLDVAMSLGNLGIVAEDQGDLAAAREYHRNALAIQEEKAPNSLDVATSLSHLGIVAERQGDLASAGEYHRKALAIREEKAPNSLELAESLNPLGKVTSQMGNLAAATEYCRKALAIRQEKAPSSLPLAESQFCLGEIEEKQGDLAEAKERFGRAWELVKNQTGGVSGDEARQAFGASMQFYAAKLIRSQLALGDLQAAFSTLEESRAQALQQLLLERQGLARAVGSALWSEYQAAVATRNRAEQDASKASVAALLAQREVESKLKQRAAPEILGQAHQASEAAAKSSEDALSAYTQARMKAEALWADIKKSLPQVLASPALTLNQASQALPPGTLYIAFSVGEDQTDVFLLRSGLHSESSLPLSAYTVALSNKKLRRLVEQLRSQIVSPSRRTAGTSMGRKLFAELFLQAARKEIAGAERLLISPDGPLWEVPFAALVSNASGAPHYLGAAKAMTYTPSLGLLAQSRSEPRPLASGQELSAVVVGNPIFNRRVLLAGKTAQGFGERSYLFLDGRPPEPLPQTEHEAIAVARLYGSTPLLGEQATEATLRQRIQTADVIHLATHGYLHPVRAMSSGVLLSVPEKEPEPGETDNDGALQAWEIYSQLRLKAELVVLSGCETGRGQEVKGEGLIGLTRAFQYAGARSIVASQWKVADRSTAALMVAFHSLLRQGRPKDEALRQAMAHLRQSRATSDPYFWAPFILFGDPDNSALAAFGTNQRK